MVEIQAINDILNRNNLPDYINKGIKVHHFIQYRNEYEYILNHFNKYDKVPDLATFLSRYSEFEIVTVAEPTDFIIRHLQEEYLFDEGVKLFEESARLLEQDSYKGLINILTKAENLLQSESQGEIHNINDMVEAKIKAVEDKRGTDGMIGISTGLPELDDVLGGWLPGEELVSIVGRVNQGKSWLLQKFLTEANKQNKKVLLYSGEMSVMQVAMRSDTLDLNYSNRQLTRGTISDADFEAYQKDIENNKSRAEYIVVTPKDIGGYLTISKLKSLIKKHNPDIIGIDQLSLMEDERRAKEKRLQYANITVDLFNLSEQYSIPILLDVQANRNKADMDNPENPELSDLAESDAIGQNSSRVISLVQTKSGLSLKITKNRYGENNRKLMYSWDIDLGIFRYTVTTEDKPGDAVDMPFKRKERKENTNVIDVF